MVAIEPGTHYYIALRACFDDVEGKPRCDAEALTDISTHSVSASSTKDGLAAPLQLRAQAVSSSSIDLTWVDTVVTGADNGNRNGGSTYNSTRSNTKPGYYYTVKYCLAGRRPSFL